MYTINSLLIAVILFALNACVNHQTQQCPDNTLSLPDCPPLHAINDEKTNNLYQLRTWQPQSELTFDPIKFGSSTKTPTNSAVAKIIGPSFDNALDSLAVKIWMIEHAQHTIDATYYIFKADLVGASILAALCNAVQRGVDVRLMVDSLGSISPEHSELKALETCTENAGFMTNEKGDLTTKKARVQIVIFNALSKLQVNRRSHDKLIIIDGVYPDNAKVMTGGRNISLDYYGINADGTKDPTAFRDLEVLVKPSTNNIKEKYNIAQVSEIYYSLLFLHKGNKRIYPYESDNEFDDNKYDDRYTNQRKKAQENLAFLKSLPAIKLRFDNMPIYMKTGFHNSKIRLTHQLNNLTNKNVITNVKENLLRNPNSILYLVNQLGREKDLQKLKSKTLRIISPYLFSGRFKNKKGEIIHDGTKDTLEWLSKHPDFKLEVITNSVLTGDNAFTQAIIDMDMAPRFLLTPDLQKIWLTSLEKGEFNPDVTNSDQWKKLINHPQVFIYQTGKIDSVILGGKKNYGKLHAKLILGDSDAFIGTSNFDYRSNLFNNEMGFFIQSKDLNNDLNQVFEELKKTSHRWGSPEWLQMRKKLIHSKSKKAGPAKKQRELFKAIRLLGLEYLI